MGEVLGDDLYSGTMNFGVGEERFVSNIVQACGEGVLCVVLRFVVDVVPLE